jgi:hypothetical protein
MTLPYNDEPICKAGNLQEFELIDRKELAPLQELIDRLTNVKP